MTIDLFCCTLVATGRRLGDLSTPERSKAVLDALLSTDLSNGGNGRTRTFTLRAPNRRYFMNHRHQHLKVPICVLTLRRHYLQYLQMTAPYATDSIDRWQNLTLVPAPPGGSTEPYRAIPTSRGKQTICQPPDQTGYRRLAAKYLGALREIPIFEPEKESV